MYCCKMLMRSGYPDLLSSVFRCGLISGSGCKYIDSSNTDCVKSTTQYFLALLNISLRRLHYAMIVSCLSR